MNARVVERIERDEVEVYLDVGSNDDKRWPMRVGTDRRLMPDEPGGLPPGSEARPTLILRSQEYAALVEAIRKEGPLGSVEAAALADAREVRNRLLVMVENEWDARVRGRGDA